MKVLVLGASGFLGGHVYQKLVESNVFKEIRGTSHSSYVEGLCRLDINDKKNFEEYYRKYNPEFVIWTMMSAENEQKLIHTGLRNLLDIIDKQTTKLIYVSSDGIFSSGKGYFNEETEPTYLDLKNPLSDYTNAKLDGEKMIRKEHKNHFIIRTGPLYGQDIQGDWDTRISTLLLIVTAKETYRRADNLFKTFVHVEDLADAMIELLAIDYTGILHVGPKTKESYYSFNLKMAKKLKLNYTLLKPERMPVEEAQKKGITLDTSLNTSKCSLLLETKFRELSCVG